MRRIYLDNAATTKVRPEVSGEMLKIIEESWANPSASYRSGRDARALLEEAREKIAGILGVSAKGVVFTSGATEANNLLIRSNAYRLREEGKGNHLITSIAEHPSVYEVFRALEREGFQVTYLGLNQQGKPELSDLEKNLTEQTSLVSIMGLNNETGVPFPVSELAALCYQKNIFFHTDFVQAICRANLKPGDFAPDAFSLNAHKIHGPKGIGLAWQNPALPLRAELLGGHQESDRRAGTESSMLVGGFAKALEISDRESEFRQQKIRELSEALFAALEAEQVRYEVNGEHDPAIGIQNIWFCGVPASQALIMLDLEGIEVSAGSACAAGSLEPSRVLTAMYGSCPRVEQSLRISFTAENPLSDLKRFASAIARIQRQLT